MRVALIGAGKFGAMFLAQARSIPGMHVAAVVDCEIERAHTALALAGWPPVRAVARSLDNAYASGGTWVTDDPMTVLGGSGLDLVIECTGNAGAGVRHALAAFAAGLHVIMVNVEADALAGPLLARRAEAAGLIYSMAYGNQPALICKMVDQARVAGFEVASAGKGTKYLPGYNAATPETVWQHLGVAPDRARAWAMNPRMYTSFIDGTNAAIEMAVVANATGLTAPSIGLSFPPCGAHDLARVLKPRWDGGRMEALGQVEVVSSEERDGRHVMGDLRRGVFVTVRAATEYAARCFMDYNLATDDTGFYAALWRPHLLIGMELGVTVASVACRGEPTGRPEGFVADVVAVAKRDLKAGEVLDGEGGYLVWGKLLPAGAAVAAGGLPIGLANRVALRHPVESGRMITWGDVAIDLADDVVQLRRAMEEEFLPAAAPAAAASAG